jgi:hypothetical protein
MRSGVRPPTRGGNSRGSLDAGRDGCYTVTMPSTIKQTAFRFYAEDLALLDAIQRHTGISTRSDALRTVMRSYARAEGISVPRPKAAKKGKR